MVEKADWSGTRKPGEDAHENEKLAALWSGDTVSKAWYWWKHFVGFEALFGLKYVNISTIGRSYKFS